MTVLEAIRRSSEFLEKKGVESPRLNAELLLAHALGMARMKLYLAFDRLLTEGETTALRELVVRRGQREPLQQITGSTSFCGYEIRITPQVLTPRPETELLAEIGWTILLKLEEGGCQQPRVLDIGTGSGCIPIALAQRCSSATVVSIDVSAEALSIARANIENHGLSERIRLVHGNLLETIQPGESFHLIVSNPPYIAAEEIATLQPEVRDYEPRLALDGGVDGLDFYRRIAAQSAAFLQPQGKIALEFGDGQSGAITNIFKEQNWIVEEIRDDYTRRPRVLVASRRMPAAGS